MVDPGGEQYGAPEDPILISVHSARQFLTRKVLNKMPDLGVIFVLSSFGGADTESRNRQGLIALMLHTNFGLNRAGTSGKGVFVKC